MAVLEIGQNCEAFCFFPEDCGFGKSGLHHRSYRAVMGKLFKEGAKGKEKKTLGGPI